MTRQRLDAAQACGITSTLVRRRECAAERVWIQTVKERVAASDLSDTTIRMIG
jgi:hypothetical protein